MNEPSVIGTTWGTYWDFEKKELVEFEIPIYEYQVDL